MLPRITSRGSCSWTPVQTFRIRPAIRASSTSSMTMPLLPLPGRSTVRLMLVTLFMMASSDVQFPDAQAQHGLLFERQNLVLVLLLQQHRVGGTGAGMDGAEASDLPTCATSSLSGRVSSVMTPSIRYQ